MARVTVEDCLHAVENRFELILAASKRARQISMGDEPFVERGNDKSTVIALREIAEGKVGREILDTVSARDHFIARHFDPPSTMAEDPDAP